MAVISFDPLWKLLIDRKMSKNELAKVTGISKSTIAKMTNGESVTLEVVARICEELSCPVCDVVEITHSD